jgi:hypothetical protein
MILLSSFNAPRGLPRLDCRRRSRCAALGGGRRARGGARIAVDPLELGGERFPDDPRDRAILLAGEPEDLILLPAVDERAEGDTLRTTLSDLAHLQRS